MFYPPWKVEEGVVAVPFEVVWNRLVGFCWVVQLSGWLRFSCWTSSRSLEDDRACVARRFPWGAELEAATLLHEELDEKRGGEKPGWTACCDAGGRLSSPWPSERVQEEPVCSSPGDGWRKRGGKSWVERGLGRYPSPLRGFVEREWRGGEHALYWPGDLTGHGAQGDQW